MTNRLGRAGRLVLVGVVLLVVAFILLPAGALLWRAWREGAWQAAATAPVQAALSLSLRTTTASALFILLAGTPLAYGLARWRFVGRRWLNALVELPVVMPPAVAGLGLLMAFGRRGLLGDTLTGWGIELPFTTAAVVIAQVFVALPFYVRAAQVGFESIPAALEEAARVDGANAAQTFLYITLPLARRALLAGLVLSWARAMGEFGATILFAGSLQGRTQTMPLLVFNILERDLNAALWTALILVGVALLTMLLARLVLQPDDPSPLDTL